MCGESFTSNDCLKGHVRKVHQGQLFTCDICEKSTSTIHTLKRHHRLLHEKTRLFQCDSCPKVFKLKFMLATHVRRIHGEIDTKVHKCTKCEKAFECKARMRAHFLFAHEGIREFQCNFCQRFFSLGTQLNVHIRDTHKNENSIPSKKLKKEM